MDEVEVYKELLAEIDQEADPRTYKQFETPMRDAQINLLNLESQFETLQTEYMTLVRQEERLT